MDFVLVRVQSDGRSSSAKIDRERTIIGRQNGCQLRIRSSEVSREHCEILIQEGTAIVKDRNSSNGTYVNGVRISEKRLEAGDLLAVGPMVFLIQISGQPADFNATELYRQGVPGAGSADKGESSPSKTAPAKTAPAATEQGSTPNSGGGGILDGLEGISSGADESSVVEFEFDFEDEEDEQRSQPPL